MKADSKENYIPLSTIYGKPNPDGTYTLTAIDIKNLNDNLYALAKKIQGGLTFADMTKEVNQEYSNIEGDITAVRVTAEGAAVTASAADGKATNAQITANGASVTASNAYGKAQSVELTVDGFTVTGPGGQTLINGDYIKSGTIDGASLVSTNLGDNSKVAVNGGVIQIYAPGSPVPAVIRMDNGQLVFSAPTSRSVPFRISNLNNQLYIAGAPLKLESYSNMSVDSSGTIYIGGSSGNSGDVEIGNGTGTIRLRGNVLVNGTPI